MFKATGVALRGTAVALIVAAGLAAAPNADAMSKEERRALTGAIVGGIAGSLLSNGDPWATAGGALAGGAIGKATTPDRRYDDRNRWRNDDRRDWERRERERREWESRERERDQREREYRQREYWRDR